MTPELLQGMWKGSEQGCKSIHLLGEGRKCIQGTSPDTLTKANQPHAFKDQDFFWDFQICTADRPLAFSGSCAEHTHLSRQKAGS